MGHVIAFVPASGGVGSSTLAAAVAVRAAAAGRSVVAVDLDRVSGSLDVVFGLEQEPGWRWPELADVAGVVAGLADAHDLTVLDLSRDPSVLARVGLLVDAVVVVSGTQVPQLAATAAVVSGVRGLLRRLRDAGRAWEAQPLLPIEPWVVLRGARIEPDLGDLVMDGLDVPLVATVGDDRRLVSEVAEGLPPGARGRGEVVRAADELLLRLTGQAVAA